MVERQMDIYGRPPRQASFDGGFASRHNLGEIKKLQVEDVVFSKGRGILVSEMAKSTWVYRSLRRFRAGIEATDLFSETMLRPRPLHLERARVVQGLHLGFDRLGKPLAARAPPASLTRSQSLSSRLPLLARRTQTGIRPPKSRAAATKARQSAATRPRTSRARSSRPLSLATTWQRRGPNWCFGMATT